MEQAWLNFDPEEIVTLHGQGQMTLRTAVERVMAQGLRGLDATIFRRAMRPFWAGSALRSSQQNGV